ncbi:MAG: ABC transporter ATP-binding protein [Evtepia sp.]
MIKRLSKSIREFKTASILTPIFVIIEVILEILIPLLMAKLIDYGIDDGNLPYVVKIGAVLLSAALLAIVAGILAGKYAAVASAGFSKNLRQDIFHHVQKFSFSNIDHFSSASIVTRLTTDVSNVQMSYMMILRMAIRAPIMLIFAFIVSFRIDAQLSLIFLGTIPVLAVGMSLFIWKVRPLFQRVFGTYDKLNRVVQENLRGIRVVKSFTRETHEKEKFGKISNSIYLDFSKAEKIMVLSSPLMQFCMYACMILVSWVGARAIVASANNPIGGLSTGELMSLITYASQILMSLMVLSMVFVMITMSKASAERISEILSEVPDITDNANPIYVVPDGSITFRDVSFSYVKNAPVLDHVDLQIKSGQTVGILGGTGASKSTLVQLIPRLYDIQKGSLLVGGIDVRQYDLDALRNQVAMVLQKNVLFSGTIKENLRWGNEFASDEDLIYACKLAQADEFISAFPDGYDTYIEQGGNNVSGGQKQRLCIARALLKHPKILILDDSTSAVDTKTDALIRSAFREELPDVTKLIIAQRISSVQDADQIIVMDQGMVCDVGTHEELLERSQIYQEVYNSQTKGGDFDGE